MSRDCNVVGPAGEAAVAAELSAAGFHVFVPVFAQPGVDLIAELDGKLIRVQVKSSAGDAPNLRFSAWSTRIPTYQGEADWLAFHASHYGITAFLKPEEVGAYPSFRYDSPEDARHLTGRMRYAKDYPLDRVIKEMRE